MVCIYCGSSTQVINSRHQKRANHIWRRRQCVNCAAIFTTSEASDLLKSWSVKKGKQLEPFSRDKLFVSLYESLRHRKQATSDATALTDTVITRLYPLVTVGAVASTDIIEVTSVVLKHFDQAAATHYRAFHPLQKSEAGSSNSE